MKTIFRGVYLLLVLMFLGCSSASKTPLEHLPEPERYVPPEAEHWTLDNGLEVYYLHDGELPLVRGSLYVRGGSLWEEEGSLGVTAATGALLRRGGAGNMSADELDLWLESIGASLSSSFGEEYGRVSFLTHRDTFEEVMDKFAALVLDPRFDERALDLWKHQSLDGIRRRGDDPSVMIEIATAQVLFPESPYGEVLESKDIQRISRTDLLRTHRRYFRPANAILSLVGDLSREEAENFVERAFGDWEGSAASLGDLPAPPAPRPPGIYFIERDLAQSTIWIAQQGPKRLTHDLFPLIGFSEIFGASGLESRLSARIREKLGLAYSVYGGTSSRKEYGMNLIILQTKAESTVLALEESIALLKDMQQNGVMEGELEKMKLGLSNQFVFRFDSPDKIVERNILLKLLEYPRDYDASYLSKVNALGPEDIQEVAQRRWNREVFAIMVVGNAEALKQLEDYAKKRGPDYPVHKLEFQEKLIFD